MTVSAAPWFSLHRLIVVLVLTAGVTASVLSFRAGRNDERRRAENAFAHRAAVRYALTREILRRQEDALFGLAALLIPQTEITQELFVAAARRLENRLEGVHAFDWVPLVSQAERAALERRPAAAGMPAEGFAIKELGPDGTLHPASERAFYYPILYLHPFAENRSTWGYDLRTAPTRDVLERARETGRLLVTPPFRLVQETANQPGIVMVLPVYRGMAASRTEPNNAAGTENAAPATGEFVGFLQSVFRVHDLLETVQRRQPDVTLDMLFVDRSETDPARRVLYYRAAGGADGRAPVVDEAAFREGLSREFPLPFGQRDWWVMFRPEAKWLDSQSTAMPPRRSIVILLFAGALAGLVHIVGRQTATIRREVDERTMELAESRRQLANMLHALPGMTFRCSYDAQLTALFLSGGARELTGWTAEELLSGTVHFRDCIHPADLERVRDATRKALESHDDVEVEYRIRTKSGEEKWVLSRGRGVYTADGTLSVFEGLAIDITAQKTAEAARLELERKLLEGQKLESLGLLAGGIAHDFNNLLSSILGNASMARNSLGPGSAVDDQLRAIESSSLRAAELCRQMLAYAGKGRFVVEATDVTALVEDLLPLLKISIAHHASLELQLTRNLPPVLADAAQLRQIVMNLVLNAADAMAGRPGAIVLSTNVAQVDHATLSACVAGAGLPAGEYVVVEVRDTGTGMSPEIMAKIFDPFFTTKFAGRGLGLAAVLGIVRGHHGALRVESTPGVGSTFRLFLPPLRAAAPIAKTRAPSVSDARRKTGKLLIIDDEEPVRNVLVAMLRMSGYEPTPAADCATALAIFRERPLDFDAVVLDLLMPGMSGEQVLQELRAIRPDVRVVLVSGYSEGDILRRLGGQGVLGFLAKPFTRGTLEAKLREILD